MSVQTMRIFLFFHGRFPSEKAASLFAAHSVDSFEKVGVQTEMVVPRRLGRASKQADKYYGLSQSIKINYLPTIDIFWIPFFKSVAFYTSYVVFSIFSVLYVLFRVRKTDVVYTNEALVALLVSIVHKRTVYEMHDFPEHFIFIYGWLCKIVEGVITTNVWKKEQLTMRCGANPNRVLVEMNAVDVNAFRLDMTKEEARRKLSINEKGKIILYTGHLYSWKGVDVLAQAMREIPDATAYFVGGTTPDVADFKMRYVGMSNIRIIGHRPHNEIPFWQAAADVLVLPNTAKESISLYATSPMKLFEYMASGRPIVASLLPSVKEIISDDAVVFVLPDDPHALAEGIRRAYNETHSTRVARAGAIVEEHTWDARASRIVNFLKTL